MAIFVYIFRGFGLLMALIIPDRRRLTIARWRKTRPHKLVYEIGGALIGLFIVTGLLCVLVHSIISGR